MALSAQMQKMVVAANKKFSNSVIDVATEGMRPIKHISTGSFMFDLAISPENGGIPVGKIMEIYGPEQAGKSTFSLIAIAERQRYERQREIDEPGYQAKACVFIDAESGFSKELAAEYGVVLEDLIYIDPETAEQAIDILEAFVRSGEMALAVVDSVPALTPNKIVESSMEQQTMGLVARLMSIACTKLNGALKGTESTIIFINQIREKVGVMYGNPETTPGGRALKFYSWTRIKVSRGDDIKNKDEVIGHTMKIHLVKNKSSRPKRVAETDLIYGVGYSREKELITMAMHAGVLVQSGAWYTLIKEGEILTHNGNPIKFQGKEKLATYMQENPEVFDLMRSLVDNQFDVAEEDLDPYDAYAVAD